MKGVRRRCWAVGTSLMLLGMSGCEAAPTHSVDVPAVFGASFARGPDIPAPPRTPALEVSTPRFPAAAVYIVYREYIHRNPGLTSLSPEDPAYQRYMERRMRELYPTRGYSGMMRDAVAEAQRNRQAWMTYEREVREYERRSASSGGNINGAAVALQCTSEAVDPSAGADPSWTGNDEFQLPPDDHIPTIQMEIDTLGLRGTEIDQIYYFESLATGTYAGGGGGVGGDPIHMHGFPAGTNLDDLIRAAGEGRTPFSGEVEAQVFPVLIAWVGVNLGIIGWKANRMLWAVDRAREKSQQFYPTMGEIDTQRDAHRHIYWNVLMRRYVGPFYAKQGADWHERNSTGAARVMDLHNNEIGRSHRYRWFRGHWLADKWKPDVWAERVRNFVDHVGVNGEYIPEWATADPTTAEAEARAACVPSTKYIYFR